MVQNILPVEESANRITYTALQKRRKVLYNEQAPKLIEATREELSKLTQTAPRSVVLSVLSNLNFLSAELYMLSAGWNEFSVAVLMFFLDPPKHDFGEVATKLQGLFDVGLRIHTA